MTDPRFTDPRHDPPVRQNVDGMWGWVAGLAAVALIAFIIIAGWNSSATNTAATNPATNAAPATTGSGAPMRNVTPPSTTGSGATSPRPAAPQPPPASNSAK